MQEWTVHRSGSAYQLTSPVISFRVTPAGGGTLGDVRWHDDASACVPESVSTAVCTGPYYDRYSLNQLPAPLPFAEVDDLALEHDGQWIVITGKWRVHDLLGTHRIRADAKTGRISISDQIEKSGPGPMRLQVLHHFTYPMDQDVQGPEYVVTVPQGDQQQTYSIFDPTHERILDQDGHPTQRRFLLTSPWLEIGEAGRASVTRLVEQEELACGLLAFGPKRKRFTLQLYGCDANVSAEQPLERSCRIEPPRALADGDTVPSAIVRQPQRRDENQRRVTDIRARLDAMDASAEGVSALRQQVVQWKLREHAWYLRHSEYEQAEALLADAEVALDAIEQDRPAELPASKELLYANDFKSFPHDWRIFGYGKLCNDPEKGMHLAPVVTVNMWTATQFEGPYLVEFDYRSTSANKDKGGTFLQLAGQCINPGDHVDFMASAMGRMPYYNFGTFCYHLSFNRGDSVQSVCNFRKTGRDFHLLSQVPDPPIELDHWYRVSMVKHQDQFLFYLDGQLILEYLEHGHQGPALDKGHIGIRNWGGQQSWIRDFRVSRI